ncbi:dihydrodipicolinate synthase family protein [Aureimonas psammosilenae]|uniref:dihydrodipicolinate synthase family protein n=1 Tax=Aureimonas psammosilenae TaxID=2495496 RepID=UPI0022A7D520|nr:dihydrodipicolinate synthase family protein [Aureimonas psammosilenae]
MFRDDDLELNTGAITRHVDFLRSNGVARGNGVLLAGGAAGDFSTMTFDERVCVAETVAEAANGAVPLAMGAQTTSTRELVALARAAERLKFQFIQVSCPFYFNHTEADFLDYVKAAAEAADVGLIIYNTFWTSAGVSFRTVEKLAEIPNVIGLKWATPRTDAMEFEDVVSTFSSRLSIIDNHLMFPLSHALGARAFEVHLSNYWPAWGLKLLADLESGHYAEVQRNLVSEAMPFYKLWMEIEAGFTSGDGYLDKLCMELVGLDSSRCRAPTRDVRHDYREKCRDMLLRTGVPGVLPHAAA